MLEATQGYSQEFTPTIWHRLGFGHAGVAPWHPDSEDETAHYLVSETHVHFDLLDRLRLLLTGRLHVSIRTKTDVPCGRAESRSAVKVKGWGWQN